MHNFLDHTVCACINNYMYFQESYDLECEPSMTLTGMSVLNFKLDGHTDRISNPY